MTRDTVFVPQRGSQGPVMRWSVRKRHGVWAIFDGLGRWHDSERTLPAAVDSAWRYAAHDELWSADGIARFRKLVDDADWWRAYLASCGEA